MKNFKTFREVAKDTIIERRARTIENVCMYGISILDTYLGGILENELVVIGAAPGIGKTELACTIAIENAKRGKRVALLSLEGDIGEIVYRYFQRKLNEGKDNFFIKPQEYRLNLKPVNTEENFIYDNLPGYMDNLFIFDKTFIPDKTKLLEMLKDIRKDCEIIIIDHLHYLDYDMRNESGEVSTIVRAIKETTEIIKRPIILISHLNRESVKSGELPTSASLHGSSNIEKNANTIILVAPGENEEYVDGFSDNELKYLRKTKILLTKSRVGIPTPAIWNTTFDLRTKNYLSGPQYNEISTSDKKNRITLFDKVRD